MSNTAATRPDNMDEAFFVVNTETEQVLHGPTTKRKADNLRKKEINFGNPIPGHHKIVTVWNPERVFESARNMDAIGRNISNGGTIADLPQHVQDWANARARA